MLDNVKEGHTDGYKHRSNLQNHFFKPKEKRTHRKQALKTPGAGKAVNLQQETHLTISVWNESANPNR